MKNFFNNVEEPWSDHWTQGPAADWYGITVKPQSILRESLAPLLWRIESYDMHRCALERKGGTIDDLHRITDLLSEPVHMETFYGVQEVALTNQDSLRRAVAMLNSNLHVEIRQTVAKMPLYYLCRTHHDYWSEYSLVVEDYYMSPGYPVHDHRFIRLMSGGHEMNYLRLSTLRQACLALLPDKNDQKGADGLLYLMGRHVFQAAWHEDQAMAFLLSGQIEIADFLHAVELVYLCLGADLCQTRSAVSDDMMRFFETTYRQPAIMAFLGLLQDLDGNTINRIPNRALALYKKLTNAFGAFLLTDIPWGRYRPCIPLWKMIYGNYSRPSLLGKALSGNAALVRAAAVLRKESKHVITELCRK